MQHNVVQHNVVQHNVVRHNVVQHNVVRHNVVQHDVVQHHVVQHNVVPHNARHDDSTWLYWRLPNRKCICQTQLNGVNIYVSSHNCNTYIIYWEGDKRFIYTVQCLC